MKSKITKENLYKRQTTLSEIGKIGQERLLNAKVLLVGCGGLGCVAAVYLAGSGVGKIHLIDFDTVSESNLPRQIFYKITDIGKPKSEVLAKYITKITPFVTVSYDTKAIAKSIVLETISDFDIVLDCTDNLPIKYLLNDACVLKDKPLVYGSLYKFDGYVSCFNVLENTKRTTNLRDAFPEIPKKIIPNCSETGTLNTIVGIIGLLQANEALKLITKTGKLLTTQILIYNSLENTQYKMKVKSKFSKEKIALLFKKESYVLPICAIQDEKLLISAYNLKENIENYTIISVIENINTPLPFEVDYTIPFSEIKAKNIISLENLKDIVVVCNKGISSYQAIHILKEKYPKINFLSLKNGITGYKKDCLKDSL